MGFALWRLGRTAIEVWGFALWRLGRLGCCVSLRWFGPAGRPKPLRPDSGPARPESALCRGGGYGPALPGCCRGVGVVLWRLGRTAIEVWGFALWRLGRVGRCVSLRWFGPAGRPKPLRPDSGPVRPESALCRGGGYGPALPGCCRGVGVVLWRLGRTAIEVWGFALWRLGRVGRCVSLRWFGPASRPKPLRPDSGPARPESALCDPVITDGGILSQCLIS